MKKTATFLALGFSTIRAFAQDSEFKTYEDFAASDGFATFALNNLWILISAALVFLMHLGFSTLESGLTQRKNTVNILFKNVFIVTMGLVTYYLWGFNTHYPGAWQLENILGFGGPAGFAESEALANTTSTYNAGYNYWADFIFQGMFAATAATIVSGAVAERIKLYSFMLYATLLVGIAYPIAGSWHWGGGFLGSAFGEGLAFYDFAGSTVVHAFGGFAALAAVLVLGPRRGKYSSAGIKPILPSSLPLAAIGVFLLWFGWFGFNGGSVLSADPALVSHVFATTSMAAAAGALVSIVAGIIFLKKPDLSMALNGILAGLVGITAGADVISVPMSLVAGGVAGALVVVAILGLDKAKIDDPVGAIAVHGICGIWGTLAVALFAAEAAGTNFVVQFAGVAAVCIFAFVFSFLVMLILKFTLGVRVEAELEEEGLDLDEHGSPAYSDLA